VALGAVNDSAARELWRKVEEELGRWLERKVQVCCHTVKSMTVFGLKIQALKIKYDADLSNMEACFKVSTIPVGLCLFNTDPYLLPTEISAELRQLMFGTSHLYERPVGFVRLLCGNCCPCSGL